MKVAFINPPLTFGPRFALNRALGGPILVAVLRQAGHDAEYIDAEALQWDSRQLAAYFREKQPDVVATTVLYHNRYACKELALLARNILPRVRLIAGGPHATTCPLEVQSWGYATFQGEGEDAILGMVAGQPLSGANLVSPDIDRIPLPAYDHCKPAFQAYSGNEPKYEWPEAVAMIVRGCPHRCGFCSHPVFGHQKPRRMSAWRVKAELEELKRRHIKHIHMYSDELPGSSPEQDRWLEGVCHEIAPLGLTYKTQGRCSRKLQLSTLQAMLEAGFKAVMWGVESFSPKVLRAMHKGIEPTDIWHTLRLSKQAGLDNWIFLMVAGPDETEEDFQETVLGLKQAKAEGLVDTGQITCMTLEPGAPLYDKAQAEGWIPQAASARSHFTGYLNLPWADPQEQNRRQALLKAIMEG